MVIQQLLTWMILGVKNMQETATTNSNRTVKYIIIPCYSPFIFLLNCPKLLISICNLFFQFIHVCGPLKHFLSCVCPAAQSVHFQILLSRSNQSLLSNDLYYQNIPAGYAFSPMFSALPWFCPGFQISCSWGLENNGFFPIIGKLSHPLEARAC